MKLLLKILFYISIICLFGFVFIGLLAVGSGHKIPESTTSSYINILIINFITIVVFFVLIKKEK